MVKWPLLGREPDLDRAAGLIESGTGIAILGPSGVGKSRLLHELVDWAEQGDMAVIRAVASESTRSIPFAPFVELLPEDPTEDRLTMLGRARRALDERTTERGLLIAVDDAHHLDETSLAFLVGAVELGGALVAMTARSGMTMASDLVDLWTNGVIARIDLSPLSRAQSKRLAESVLGTLTPDLEEQLWRLARGNPLLLHELLEGSRDRAIVPDDEGRWTLDGRIAESARLADLVASRLRVLTDEAREAMAVVALGAPLSLSLARSAIGETMHELEDRGLVSVVPAGVESTLMPAHPLYGEILAANLAESRRRTAYRRLVETAVEHGPGPDQLRVAVWQSRSGTVVSEELARGGASEALIRHEPELAETLIRSLGIEDARSLLILGRALSYQQRFEEAEQVLSQLPAGDVSVEGELVSIRAQNLAFGLGRTTEARDLLAAGVSRINDPGMRARLNNERGMVSAISGDFVDARSASRAVLSDDESSEVARVAAYVTLTLAQAMTGDCHGLDGVVSEALDLAEDHRAALPFARDQIEIMRFCSLLNAGRIDEANDLASLAIDRSGRGGALVATWLAASCIGLDLAGRLEQAASTVREALELYKNADPFGLEAQARGVLSMILGQLGAEAASRPIEGTRAPAEAPRIAVWLDRGRVWSAAAAGQIDDGADIAVAGGRSAASREHFAWAALCFHDAVRLGRAELSIDELRAIDDSKGAFLLSLMKRHAEALLVRDPGELDDVARAFGEHGARLLAAEAFGQTADILRDRGDLTQAARACALSYAFEKRCEAPDTPALRHRPQLITSREIEVAIRAASGLTSPQIAEEFFISVRTVDNHLRSVYRKLNIGGREELARLLGESLAVGDGGNE